MRLEAYECLQLLSDSVLDAAEWSSLRSGHICAAERALILIQ
jgi:hypothetical protein